MDARSEYKKEWARKNPDKVRASKARHRAAHSSSIARGMRGWSLKTRFGLTPDEYETMLSAQGGVCAICAQPEKAHRNGKPLALAVDHEHKTGSIRGLLCAACNCALGLVGDDTERLRFMIAYLERNQ